MFFLHALATRRRTLTRAEDAAGLARLPSVTVFEKSSGCGGVWRSDRTCAPSDGTGDPNMYEALWTNGAKENFEFHDYSFEDHFGVGTPLPMFLPRALVLEYFMARVTRNETGILDDVRFDTAVTSVAYDGAASHFVVAAGGGERCVRQSCLGSGGER